jgi:hypothetical protein
MDSDDYEQTDKMYPRNDIGKARPVHQHARSLPVAKQANVGQILDDMQRRGVIEESDSPWSSLVVLVRKNGDLRLCVDYRQINDVTR